MIIFFFKSKTRDCGELGFFLFRVYNMVDSIHKDAKDTKTKIKIEDYRGLQLQCGTQGIKLLNLS